MSNKPTSTDMISKELRIGNIVSIIDRSNEIHIPSMYNWVVFSLNPFELEVHGINENPAQSANLLVCKTSNIVPIELTEEWAINLGFKLWMNEDCANFYELGRYYLVFTSNDIGFGVQSNKDGWILISNEEHFRYVHQLQNLYYALTGEELKVNNI